MRIGKGPPPCDRVIILKSAGMLFPVEWSQEGKCWTTRQDGVQIPEPVEWFEYECFIVEYDDPGSNKMLQHRYFDLPQALSMIEFLARTGSRITLYQE